MNQSAVLKKKGSNPNKAQSPLKNLDVDMQYHSSAELVNTFKIKREHVANERNNKAKKEHVPISLKRKNFEDFIPQQGKRKGQNKPRLFQSGESIQEKGFKPSMHNFRFQTSSKEGVTSSVHVIGTTLGNGEEQHDIQDLLSFKQVKKKSLIPATSLDQFQKQQGIVIGDERKQINHTVADVKYMHAPSIHEHNKGLDALEDQEEIGEDECAIDEEVDINCSTKGISKQKQVRGKTTCKNIHARNLEEREEVTFDKGQAVGPADKIVSELTNFIGTIARNPRFINLMYTSWHAVPKDIKKRMWEYINSKFLIPVEGKKWVMTGLRDAWRRHKQKIKERCFDKNSVVEDMLAKRPDDIPEAQFCQLIEYWKHPTVQVISEVNSKNRKQQRWRHRMGPINFARVRVALRATKENNEEPSHPEMFIATRTKTGKEIQADTQVAITELQNRQNSGETADDAFMAVFGKEQPGRLRWYGRSVTTRSLKEDEETNKLKQKHANEFSSLKEEMNEMRVEMRHFFSQLLQNNPALNVQDIPGVVGSNLVSPIDASSAQAVRGQNIPHSSGSTHDSVLQKKPWVGSEFESQEWSGQDPEVQFDRQFSVKVHTFSVKAAHWKFENLEIWKSGIWNLKSRNLEIWKFGIWKSGIWKSIRF
ncbi:hypothetical protein MTR67_040309 [Solanum verrucosum]|uniref:Uncharacterized protein n=1 Tax=Solanum verrucosum TaxID=315347 RepID=A0AAF0ZS02_SOLVR|nr:hypothetical protein MTR67_040309 [Solanum verrucosum]